MIWFNSIPSSWAWQIESLNRALRVWEEAYNTVRPHQALGYLTPQRFLAQAKLPPMESKCH